VVFPILESSVFRTSRQLEPNVVSPRQSNAVILPSVSSTIRSFEPSFVSLGGSKNRDSTVVKKMEASFDAPSGETRRENTHRLVGYMCSVQLLP